MKKSVIINISVWSLLLAAGAASTGMAVHYRTLSEQKTEKLQQAEETVQSLKQAQLAASEEKTGAVAAIAAGAAQDTNLTARIRELEIQLQSSANLIASLQAAQTNQWHREDRPRRDRNAWMEELKTSDPERYKEMMARREEAQRKMNESFAAKAAHFLDRDTSAMSEEEAAQYHQMINLLDETWRLAENLNADLPRDQRWPLMRQMHENIETLTPLLDAERISEFQKIATDFGYDDAEAAQFVEYMNNVVEVTSMRSFFESMGRGRGGPPGGPDRGGGEGGGSR
ncbi:MAG: hypothetical protein AB7T27_06560 [Kiritimatiellia bacterium]